MKKNTRVSLETQIQKVIGYRTLACVFVLLSLLTLLTIYDVSGSINHLQENINGKIKPLENFTVSQLLINNSQAIDVKLDSFNHTNSGFSVEWKPNPTSSSKAINWKLPFSWSYNYQLGEIAGYPFGHFIISGSLLSDHEFIHDLFIRLGLLIIFILTILIFLYPLAKKIPQQIFINPINRFIRVISNPDSDYNSLPSDLPIELEELENKILILLNQIKEQERNQTAIELGKLATQVAHDIRAPLAVLNLAANGLSNIPEKSRLEIKHSAQRVNDIANNLLSKYRCSRINSDLGQPTPELAYLLIDSIISEKRIQLSTTSIQINFDYDDQLFDAFIKVNGIEFKRVLSNILNNSIEAVKSNGVISIALKVIHDKVYISIHDNGCGIPQEKLTSVFNEGESFGKKDGLGLGLTYAAKEISAWQGTYSILSEVNHFTQFDITLPLAKPASWFLSSLIIPQGTKIVILDDDKYIHEAWNTRFTPEFIKKYQLEIFHYCNPLDFKNHCQTHSIYNTLFLLDYEFLGFEENGLELAEKFHINHSSILVTSRYEDNKLRSSCQKLAIKILPKPYAHLVKFQPITPTQYVLIDDDKLITKLWLDSAELAGKHLSVFSNPHDFIRAQHLFNHDTIIYIDSSLEANVKGEAFAKQLYDLGYRCLILTTGYPKENFSACYWLNDVIGKQPSF